MTRCSRCLLTSSLPGSNFDESNECYWCQSNYPNYNPEGAARLKEILEQNRSEHGSADCLVGVSGGKDSSYVLLQLQQTFGMRVEAFTYAHDGSTPFSLENARIVCRNLDVKQHIVSLPNHEHLESFKTFFKAWLECPTRTSAAMVCVACKHLHILGTELAVKRNIPMLVWSTCPLENPPFIALEPKGTKGKDFERQGMFQSAVQLTKEMIHSRQFAAGFFKHFSTCTYGCLAVVPTAKYLSLRYPSKQHILFFRYCEWNPTDIIREIVSKAGWKPPANVPDDWHSDCLFNVFKEYMFQKMLGVSYTDAFLSNQIRHGILRRDEAWDMLVESKEYYAQATLKVLDAVGLGHLKHQIDTSCFLITDDI